jgi:hypothetical protein
VWKEAGTCPRDSEYDMAKVIKLRQNLAKDGYSSK